MKNGRTNAIVKKDRRFKLRDEVIFIDGGMYTEEEVANDLGGADLELIYYVCGDITHITKDTDPGIEKGWVLLSFEPEKLEDEDYDYNDPRTLAKEILEAARNRYKPDKSPASKETLRDNLARIELRIRRIIETGLPK